MEKQVDKILKLSGRAQYLNVTPKKRNRTNRKKSVVHNSKLVERQSAVQPEVCDD